MRMPVLDGLSATRIIRYLEKYFGTWMRGMNAVPIMALSASADPEEKKAALAAGCNDYLVKPLRKETFMQLLLKCAQDKQ
jgi:CheY-like chemotaxis protein